MSDFATIYINGKPLPGVCEITSFTAQDEPQLSYANSLSGPATTTISFECTVGIRESRWLLTGRPRPPRHVTKRINREARDARREFVHAAGCTERHCASFWFRQYRDWVHDGAIMPERKVSVPRSLRRELGRYYGGAK